MKTSSAPYLCHLFICTKDRQGNRKSCADGGTGELKAKLKDAIRERGLKGKVRVSESSCLGLCEHGPNVIVYPQQIVFNAVEETDLPQILQHVEEWVESGES